MLYLILGHSYLLETIKFQSLAFGLVHVLSFFFPPLKKYAFKSFSSLYHCKAKFIVGILGPPGESGSAIIKIIV